MQPSHARCLPSPVSLTQLYPIALSPGTTVGVMWTTGACVRERGQEDVEKRETGETARTEGEQDTKRERERENLERARNTNKNNMGTTGLG